ncbi:DNA repair protein RadC [Gilliamella sp. Pas-s25]|nr:DNA repair protein RadC [Gilliamella sp. Pas-s25]
MFCSVLIGEKMKTNYSTKRIVTTALKLLEKQMKIEKNQFTKTKQVIDYLRLKLTQKEREHFVAMYLNNQHQLIKVETLFMGTINSVEIHPREIIKQALRYNAAAVIFAHNHPSGESQPSNADRNINQKLTEILNIVDIRVLDHIVIGKQSYFSFAERSWL